MASIIDTFDKTKQFENQIAPKIEEICNLCTMYGIPFFWTACVKSEPEKTEYRYKGFLTGSHGIHLYDDQITAHLKVIRGFVPQVPNLELNMGDIDGNLSAAPLQEDEEVDVEDE